MNLYQSQKAYFKTAYEKEKTPWPNSNPTPQVNEFLSIIKRNLPSGKMLDMGCGEGRHSALFQENGFISFGVDYQPQALKKALLRIREASGEKSGGPYFLAGDIFNLPFSPQNFDVILDYGCLHHIRKRDFKIYLGILLKMLKPGGFYILSCFSTGYKHYPGEKRTRDWLTHKGHYDRFFNQSEFPILFGADFDMMRLLEEKEGIHEFFHVLMRKK
ncbi:MAG: class I SAM-dependent methyltransferase [Nitrospirae bacterium]|nr:class I SAM-dependent methyltransferase [Nitrospirota bacterium]MBI3352915.1 class I SAM-dependent methyltransferase [Nitrospirota bacterium]